MSCPVCWAVKPRNTLWLHLTNSASCESWQLKYLGLGDGTKKAICKHCGKSFYREADMKQHEKHCTAQPVPEPKTGPKRRSRRR